ncbi:hypothetical protein [Streptomyces sp. Wb2n-11]|uniref:hypothetical protein n=1 Tax=Streptomyces sp. Wb2n-11 TaxID=1030533 RepID=UPI000A9FAA79|nr:hypothetical protein [Streptomyces sp. Wb2n-11]
MSSQAGEDILSWLDTAITKAEADADRWHDAECSSHGTTILDLTVLQDGATLCDCEGPSAVRRRCVADRKLIAAHPITRDVIAVHPDGTHGFGCSVCHNEDLLTTGDGWCDSLRALAEGYGWTEGER